MPHPTEVDEGCDRAFSPDGLRLASASVGGAVRVWETVRLPLTILRQQELRERPFDLVEDLFATHLRRADVIQALRRGNPTLTHALQDAALTLAEQYHHQLGGLNGPNWAVVSKPGASADAYRHALLQAEEACRLTNKKIGALLNTLGAAQYRVGQYEAALKTFLDSEKLNATPEDGPHPSDLVFLRWPSIVWAVRRRLGRRWPGCRRRWRSARGASLGSLPW